MANYAVPMFPHRVSRFGERIFRHFVGVHGVPLIHVEEDLQRLGLALKQIVELDLDSSPEGF